MNMDIRPIRTEADYDWALAQLDAYFDHEPPPGTPEAARFEVLLALTERYEAHRWTIDPPEPVTLVQQTMAFRGATQSDLAAIIGSRSRASEFLRGKRPLTVDQAFRLQAAWNLPITALLQARSQTA